MLTFDQQIRGGKKIFFIVIIAVLYVLHLTQNSFGQMPEFLTCSRWQATMEVSGINRISQDTQAANDLNLPFHWP